MQIPPEIAFHHVKSSPAAEQQIRNRIAKLEHIYDRLITCRVRVDQRVPPPNGTIPPVVRIEMGVPGQYYHQDMVKAFETTIAACKRHKKWAGMGGLYNEEGYRKYVPMGVRMVLAGADLGFMMGAGGAAVKALRGLG